MKIRRIDLVDLYTDYLLCSCGSATATGMSAALDYRISHDIITDLLNSEYIRSKRLWTTVKPMCAEIEQQDAVLIIDDSVEAKPYTDCNELIGWHFDHTAGRSVKSVNSISAIYHSWEMSLPVGISLVKKNITYTDVHGRKKRKSSISKHQHLRALIQHGSERLKFRYVLSCNSQDNI